MINIFKRNLKIKLISIFFAFFMWIYVMAEVDPILIRDFNNIPVNIININMLKEKNMIMDPEQNLQVNLILRGRRSLLKDINKSKMNIYGEIKTPKLGKNTVALHLDLPSNIEYSIIPSKLMINIEENVRVKKNIEIDKTGKLPESLKVSDITLTPKYTMIEGPKSLVSKVDKLVCKVNVENKSSNFYTKSQVSPIDKHGNKVEGIKIKDEYIDINVGIFKSKEVPVKIKLKGSLGESHKLLNATPNIQKITITGNKRDIDKITEVYTEELDLSNLGEDKNINLKINLPRNIKTNSEKINVNLEIGKLISKEFLISKNRIVYNNNIQNLDISKNDLPEQVKVKLVFLEDLEKKINEEDIQLFVNLQESDSKISKFEIKYTIPHSVEKVEIEPKYVTIASPI